ncbi:MAG: hypothetical protein KAT48_15075 [Bacteroidales bacterium]|nr:hypothetical protein [Bacteroidales bacterium]
MAFRIVTPYSAVNTPIDGTPNRITWIPNCTEKHATEIDIIITSFNSNQDKWPGKNKMGTKLIGSYNLNNGETVWIIFWTIPMPDLSALSGKAFQFYKGRNKQDLTSKNLRAIGFAEGSDE